MRPDAATRPPRRYRSAVIRPLDPYDGAACDAIVASLSDWFGLEDGIRECASAVRTQPGLVAEVDGEVAGFLTLARPYPRTPEISWLAVDARERRRGIGRALIVALSHQLRTHGDRLVLVKTLSDRTDPGRNTLKRAPSTSRWVSCRWQSWILILLILRTRSS